MWALQELAPLIDADDPYIQVPPDKTHLLEGNVVVGAVGWRRTGRYWEPQ